MAASAQGLVDYVGASPSPYHCVAVTASRLELAGFVELDERLDFCEMRPGERYYVRRDGTLVAWIAGQLAPAAAGFRLVGAHTDSPNLRLKPNAEYAKEGYLQWGVEVYGGVLVATWADRDLGLSGRVALRTDQGVQTRLLRIDRPIARIPNLAIHLNRKVNDEGLVLNKQSHLPPMLGLASEGEDSVLRGLVASELAVEAEQLLGWDLMLHDVSPPVLGGLRGDFVFSPRMDNQASCYTALEGLLAVDMVGASTAVIVLFDHEECGSQSPHGAKGSWLEHLLRRVERAHTESAPGGYERAATNSYMVSADMAHGVHPNYADQHDGNHKPVMNGGPVVKVNTNQRYASNAETAGLFKAACAELDVPMQEFINRTDLACGTTIGPISAANLAIRSVDVGGAMLSMHSIREQAGADDVAMMAAVKSHLLAGHLSL